MKLLYATDPHLKGKNPSNRLDNFSSEILMLFDELKDVARQEDVTAVLLGGDLFDTPKISQRLYNKLQRVLKKIDVPIYVVPGNHDIFGQNTDTLEDTMLGSLDAGGIIQLVTRDYNGVTITDAQDGTVVSLQAQEYTESLDEGNTDDYDVVTNLQADVHILMTHSMLTAKPFIGKHTLIKDVRTSADIILAAHYHPGFDIVEEGNTTFVGPGAMGRLEATKTEATRKLQYAIIDIDKTGYEVALHPFKNQRPGADIFDLQKLKDERVRKDALSAFRKQVDDTNNFEGQDVNQILKSIATANNIDFTLVLKAMNLIIESEQQDDQLNQELAGFVEASHHRRITKVTIVNFQSWESAEIEFDAGLNALTGASDNGKTAIIRAIRWALYNDPKGSDFIRHGKKRAYVSIEFDDGSIIIRERTAAGAGTYAVIQPNGDKQEFTGFGNNIPIQVSNAHQMPKIQLTKDSDVSLNIGYQLDGPFLIGDSPANRAAVIGRLTGVHVVDISIRNNAKTIVNLQRDISANVKLEAEMQERLVNDFNDVPVLEQSVNQLELLITRLDALSAKEEELRRIKVGYDNAANDIKTATVHLVKLTPGLAKAQGLLQNLVSGMTRHKVLSNLGTGLNTINDTLNDIKKDMSKLEHLHIAQSKVIDLTDAVSRHKELSRVAQQLNTETKYIEGLTATLDTWTMPSMKDVKKLESLNKRWEDVHDVQQNIFYNEKHLTSYTKDIKFQETEIIDLTQRYKDTLKKAGKCPTCHTPLNDALLEQLSL